jgi:hypothetical protein
MTLNLKQKFLDAMGDEKFWNHVDKRNQWQDGSMTPHYRHLLQDVALCTTIETQIKSIKKGSWLTPCPQVVSCLCDILLCIQYDIEHHEWIGLKAWQKIFHYEGTLANPQLDCETRCEISLKNAFSCLDVGLKVRALECLCVAATSDQAETKALALRRLGSIYLETGFVKKAIHNFGDAIKLTPENPRAQQEYMEALALV